jgi:excisionase family DNA binding protein
VTGQLEAALREILRDVVRDELRTALAAEARPRQAGPTAPASEDAYLSVANAAQLADLAPNTIRTWIRDGRLVAHRAGRVLRVRRSELTSFLSVAPPKHKKVDIAARARQIAKAA